MRGLEKNLYALAISAILFGCSLGVLLEKRFHYHGFFLVLLMAATVVALAYLVLHWDFSATDEPQGGSIDSVYINPWTDVSGADGLDETEAVAFFVDRNRPLFKEYLEKQEYLEKSDIVTASGSESHLDLDPVVYPASPLFPSYPVPPFSKKKITTRKKL